MALDRDRYWFRNGTLYANSDRQVTTVLIGSTADLEDERLIKQLEPGTVAHVTGGAESYELSPEYKWVKVTGNIRGGGTGSGSGSDSGSGSGNSGEGTTINDGDTVVVEGMTAEERMRAEGGN